MGKRPDFDLKKVIDNDSFKKVAEFLPKLRESNQRIESELKRGLIGPLDSQIEFYNDNHPPEIKLEEEKEESILLDVGLGVFDVKGETPSDEALKKAGVSVVNLKEDLPYKTELGQNLILSAFQLNHVWSWLMGKYTDFPLAISRFLVFITWFLF
ncbi:conserved hypothetical protein [Theileria orientalis strain Shintoku]|uniref:Uncharacterized protein n=1 Tax=Theileria orientalis strain Shintoku TaxID=869250 RepID=J4C2J6_THEOR|nr:conserved hypothetical protein [Theileria orientalis strain Shintoku]BAM38806.1 conserved hypothetical protein [Theileria orientalis strain Shintoku]|eukprot:XP_009689107.1 conserved hypothetical protein [Theileria orientalis strain Shintoku]